LLDEGINVKKIRTVVNVEKKRENSTDLKNKRVILYDLYINLKSFKIKKL
jgi:hypothetical protein